MHRRAHGCAHFKPPVFLQAKNKEALQRNQKKLIKNATEEEKRATNARISRPLWQHTTLPSSPNMAYIKHPLQALFVYTMAYRAIILQLVRKTRNNISKIQL